jgi:hypothetical protein
MGPELLKERVFKVKEVSNLSVPRRRDEATALSCSIKKEYIR